MGHGALRERCLQASLGSSEGVSYRSPRLFPIGSSQRAVQGWGGVGPGACDAGWRQEAATGKRRAHFPTQPTKLLLAMSKPVQKDKRFGSLIPNQLSLQPEHCVYIKPLSVLGFWGRQSSQTQRPWGPGKCSNREAGLVRDKREQWGLWQTRVLGKRVAVLTVAL